MSLATSKIELLPKQRIAMACPAFELLYGGSKGGAKTHFLVLCVLPLIEAAHRRFLETKLHQHHVRIIFFRKNLDDLQDIQVKQHKVYPIIDPGAEFNKVQKTWTFTSGATVQNRHLADPDSHEGYNGNELMMVLFDQVEQLPFNQYSFIIANVRTSDPYYRPFLAVRSSANPGGPHSAWVKQRFIEPCGRQGGVVKVKEKLGDDRVIEIVRAFVPSKLKDNKFLYEDGQYEAQLRATWPEHLLKRYLDGDWDVVDGAFFADKARPDSFERSFLVPASWDLGFGLDWGAANPACTLICAYDDNNDRVYVIDELHTPGISGSRYAEHMLDLWRHQKWSSRTWAVDEMYGLIDKEAADVTGAEGATPADVIAMAGFRIFPAQKSRSAGITQILERLQPLPDGKPGLIIFEDRAPNLKRALMSCQVARDTAEDYDKRDPGAHALDALRFYLMDKPVRPRLEVNGQDADMQRWEKYMRAARQKKQHEAPERDW